MRRFGRRRHGSRAGSRRHFLLHAPAAASERVKKRWSRTRSARAALVRDTVDDPIARDFDFTPSEGWTATTYKAKKQNLAAALNELHGGLGPELLGVAEVEGDQVFEELIAETGNTHLKVVKDPPGTSDLRGIDVSLAYDDRKLSVVDKHSHVVHLRYQTRDIFDPGHLRSHLQGEGHERGAGRDRQPLAFTPPRKVGVGAASDCSR
jgi:Endonuclease/Exonuclease/phosphatase family